MNEVRLYQCDLFVWTMPPKHCVFCKHCADVFYDDSNGPYMCICELFIENKEGCTKFEDDGYIFDEKAYLDMLGRMGLTAKRNPEFNDKQIVSL